MSRIGKKPILIPESVQVKIEGSQVTIKGQKGELSKEFRPEIKIEAREREIVVLPTTDNSQAKALWGLSRQLLANMVKGVMEGYEKKLEIEGLGFKVTLQEDNLLLNVGFSHLVKIPAPPGIKFFVEKNVITVSGIDKELVGQTAANIRKVRKPEPYKGKGIRYVGEIIRRKLGKKAVATK